MDQNRSEPDLSHNSNNSSNKFEEKRCYFLFVCQMIIVMSVVLASILNLSLPSLNKTNREIWITLLSASVGNILPTPKMKKNGVTL